MTENIKQIIEEELAKLPPSKQKMIRAVDWGSIAEQIGREFSLTDEEIDGFQIETFLVLMGIIYPGLYKKNIENNIGVDSETAGKLEEAAVQRIFSPVADVNIEEIKKKLKEKDPDWQQAVNFILSGGDYSAFVENTPTENVIEKQ